MFKGIKCKAISNFPPKKMINSTSNSIQLLHPYSKVKIDSIYSIYTLSRLKAFGVIILRTLNVSLQKKENNRDI